MQWRIKCYEFLKRRTDPLSEDEKKEYFKIEVWR
jgi:hypothetical protein